MSFYPTAESWSQLVPTIFLPSRFSEVHLVVALRIQHYAATFLGFVLLEQKMILCVSTENVYWKAYAVAGALRFVSGFALATIKFCSMNGAVLRNNLFSHTAVAEEVAVPSHFL